MWESQAVKLMAHLLLEGGTGDLQSQLGQKASVKALFVGADIVGARSRPLGSSKAVKVMFLAASLHNPMEMSLCFLPHSILRMKSA